MIKSNNHAGRINAKAQSRSATSIGIISDLATLIAAKCWTGDLRSPIH
jgi:hypothetical protein